MKDVETEYLRRSAKKKRTENKCDGYVYSYKDLCDRLDSEGKGRIVLPYQNIDRDRRVKE